MWRSAGQSTIEYLLIIAGIVAALILAKGFIGTKVRNSYERMANMVEDSVDSLPLN